MNDRGIVIGLVVLVLVVLVGSMLGGGMMGPGMMWGYAPQGVPPGLTGLRWGLGMGFGWLAMLAFWGALLAGLVLLLRSVGNNGKDGQSNPTDEPITILQRRYAAGELTREEYERMRRDLAA